jgi:hypothetical protein
MDSIQCRRNVRPQAAQRRRRIGQGAGQRCGRVATLERRPPCQEEIERGSNGIDIGALVKRILSIPLWFFYQLVMRNARQWSLPFFHLCRAR